MTLPLRVVRLITWLPVGGIERRLVAVLPRLDRALFAPEVICLRERGPLAAELERAGVPLHVEPLRSRLGPGGLLRLARRLRGAAIVHTHMYRANVPGTIAARLAGVPVIVGQVHNVDTWETWRQRFLDRLVSRWRCATVAVSRRVQSDVCAALRLPPARVPLITNGIDLAPFAEPLDREAIRRELGLRPGEVAVICVARLHRQKRHGDLLAAAAMLPSGLPPWQLFLAGDGPERGALEALIRASGLQGRVRLLGQRDDVARLLRASDVSVLVSEREGFSNAVVESLAAGVPVVATDVGGNPDAVADGETGFLISVGDTAALANRLARLIADPDLRAALGARARTAAPRFGLQAMVHATERLYLECLRRARPDLWNEALERALQERVSAGART